ncbi:MAG: methionyl-tRNA formyltransferase [Gammaproteobacteria bacterium]|nr:MAG: methionyl-tRNA formyltransferase [Gammaproteobacteria bacterium]
MNIIFAGTPDFAVPPLEALILAGHTILAVYTQPDRPAGRGRKLTPSPVKDYAEKQGIPIYQPENFKHADDIAALSALKPDLMVVVAYGLILPIEVLTLPRLGCLNIHASLLPRWRGAAPIQRVIEAGDTVSGITIMQMDTGLDTGAMLDRAETPIQPEDTAQTLHDRLAQLGAERIVSVMSRLEKGGIAAIQQDDAQASYARKLSKAEAAIDWSLPAKSLARKIQAFNPWPVASTHHAGKRLRIWRAEALSDHTRESPGTVLDISAKGITVQTGKGRLLITQLQAEGGKPLESAVFLNGHPLRAGDTLGKPTG